MPVARFLSFPRAPAAARRRPKHRPSSPLSLPPFTRNSPFSLHVCAFERFRRSSPARVASLSAPVRRPLRFRPYRSLFPFFRPGSTLFPDPLRSSPLAVARRPSPRRAGALPLSWFDRGRCLKLESRRVSRIRRTFADPPRAVRSDENPAE